MMANIGCGGMVIVGVLGLLYSCGPNILVGFYKTCKTVKEQNHNWKLESTCWTINMIPLIGPFIGYKVWYRFKT